MRTERNSTSFAGVKTTTTIEYDDGDTLHYVNGLLHRSNGPAVKTKDGYELWFCHGRLHRNNGPAYIGPEGMKEYWLGGEKVSKCQFIEMQAEWIKDLHRRLMQYSDDKTRLTGSLFTEIKRGRRYRDRAFAVRKRSLFWHKIASDMGEINVKMMKQTEKKADRFPVAVNTCLKCEKSVKMQAIYVGRNGPYCSDGCARDTDE
jgi:hypothetical protein